MKTWHVFLLFWVGLVAALICGCSSQYAVPTAVQAAKVSAPSPTATVPAVPSPTPSATPVPPTVTPTATPACTATPTSTPFPDPWIVEGTSSNFNQEALAAPLPVLVVFYATWCPHCAVMDPAAQQFASDEGGKVKVVMVDVDAQSALSSAYNVTGLPTCIFFKNGVETSQQIDGSYDTSAEDESALISLFNGL